MDKRGASLDFHQDKVLLRCENVKLIDEIQRLKIENEDIKFKNNKMSSDLNRADEIISKYKKKSKSLINSTDILEDNCHMYIEELDYYRHECELYKQEYNQLKIQNENLSIELENLCKDFENERLIIQQIKEERNIALDGAEKLQSSFSKLKEQTNEKIKEMLLNVEKLKKENDDLTQINKSLEDESTKLKIQAKNISRDLNCEKNQNKKLDSQLRDLIHQLKLKEQEFKRLESDLGKYEDVRRENKRINAYTSELKRKIACLENEISESKRNESKSKNLIEKLRQTIRRNSSNDKLFKTDVDASTILSNDNNNIEPMKFLSSHFEDNLMDKINSLKSKISSRNYSREDFLDELNINQKDSKYNQSFQLENVFAEIEIDRSNFLDLVSCLETKISNLLVEKASMQAQLIERSNQLSDLQRDIKEKMANDFNFENECRKKSYHVSILESQVEDNYGKLQELHIKYEQLEKKLAEKNLFCEEIQKTQHNVEELLLQKSYQLDVTILSLRELQAEHNKLNENFTEIKEKYLKSENKCKELQENLNEVLKATSSLKFDIQQSNDHNTIMINSLENELRNENEKCKHLEKNLTNLEEKYKLKSDELELSKIEFTEKQTDLSNKNKALELECNDLISKIDENKNYLKTCEEEMKMKESKFRELILKAKYLNETMEDMKTNYTEQIEKKKIIIEELNGKIKTLTGEFDIKEKECRKLLAENENMMKERKSLVDEFGNEMKKFLKEYKKCQKMNETYKEDLSRLQFENSQLLADITTLKDKCSANSVKLFQAEDLLNREKSTNINLKTEVDRQNYDIQSLNLNLKSEQNSLSVVEKDLKELKKELLTCKNTIERQKYEIDQLELRNVRLEEALDVKGNEIQKQNVIITELDIKSKEEDCNSEQKFIQLTSEINNYKTELKDTELKVNNLNKNVEFLTDKNKELKSSNSKTHKLLERTQKENESYKLVADNFEKVNKNLKNEIENVRTIIFTKEHEINAFKDVVSKLDNEILYKSTEIANYKTINDDLKENLKNLKNIMQTKENKILEFSELIKSLNREKDNYENDFLVTKNQLQLENERLKADLIRINIEHSRLQSQWNNQKDRTADRPKLNSMTTKTDALSYDIT